MKQLLETLIYTAFIVLIFLAPVAILVLLVEWWLK